VTACAPDDISASKLAEVSRRPVLFMGSSPESEDLALFCFASEG
jgi:hypothetical protein